MAVAVVRDVRMIIQVTGEIDIANVSELDSALDDAVRASPDGFVVDASGVSYIDGMGIRAILGAWQRVKDGGGTLALVSSDVVGRLLNIVGAKGIPCLLTCESVQTAVDALTRCIGNNRCSRV